MTQVNVAPAARVRKPSYRQANTTPGEPNAPGTPPPVPSANGQPPAAGEKPKTNWEAIRELLDKKLDAIAKVIPPTSPATAEGIVQNAIQQIETSRESAKLKLSRPSTVLYSVLACAAAGLDFANDMAYLVAHAHNTNNNGTQVFEYWECRMWAGYRGLINLAARVGYALDVQAVFEGETCTIKLGTDNEIEHIGGWATDVPIIGVYCIVRLKDTGVVRHIERMGVSEIDAIAKLSRSPAWKTASRAEMAKKVVAKRGFKWIDKDSPEVTVLNEVERRNETDESLGDLVAEIVRKHQARISDYPPANATE